MDADPIPHHDPASPHYADYVRDNREEWLEDAERRAERERWNAAMERWGVAMGFHELDLRGYDLRTGRRP